MPTDVIMPQMGESIFEGTLTKWLKKVGDTVQRDEPLFEISTDKVDAEIPAPATGVLREQKVAEGTTVQVNSVVGVIDAEGAPAAAGAAKSEAPAAAKSQADGAGQPAQAAASTKGGAASTDGPGQPAKSPANGKDVTRQAKQEGETEISTTLRDRPDVETAAKGKEAQAVADQQQTLVKPEGGDGADGGRIHSSPLVRRIAGENNIDLSQVTGTGASGRISKEDILGFIAQHGAGQPGGQKKPVASAPAASQSPVAEPPASAPSAVRAPARGLSSPAPGEIVPMSNMRKKIAQHMVESKHTSAHVHTVFEVDMTRIVRLREKQKAGFEQRTGSKLTFMPFFARATVNAIGQFPILNSSMEGENIHYKREINLGIAVALDWGLIVPVVKNAEERNFLGLQRAITDVGNRARNKKLSPDEVSGGTFTITNPGQYGPMFGLPIINQPQVAILGIGGIKKAAVVLTDEDGVDSIAVRSLIHLTLGYDHRVIDGAVADQFMATLKKYLENWNEEIG